MAKNLSFYNLTGGLNTVQDLFTINSTPNRTESPEMKNVEYFKLGGLKSMEGNTPIGSQFKVNGATDKITLGYEYTKDNNQYMVITTFSGGCYLYDEKKKVFNKFYNFPSNTERHSIASYLKGIVITNGVDDLLYYELNRDNELTGKVKASNIDSQARIIFDNDFNPNQLSVGQVVLYQPPGWTPLYLRVISIVQPVKNEDESVTPGYAIVAVTTPEKFVNNEWSNEFGTVYGIAITIKQTPFNIVRAKLVNSDEANPIEPRDIKGLAINSYKGRLWIGGSDGVLYYSELGLLTFDIKFGAGAYDNFFEDSSDIKALGVWSEYLVCHKKNFTYLVDANADKVTDWTVKPYSEMSCESQQSFLSNDIGYYIFDKNNKGIYPLFTRSIYNTTYMGKELSVKINNLFQYLDYTNLDKIYISYHPQKQYLNFYMTFLNGNGYSNKCYIYNFLTKSWIYRELPQQVTIAFQFNNNLYIGTQDGYVLKEFTGSSFNGEPIEFKWVSPSYVWGGGTNKTTTREFRVKLNNINSNNFNINSIRDGLKRSKRSRNITNNKDNGTSLVWDTGYNFADMVLKDVELDVFHYQATNEENKDYYSLDNAIIHNDIKMYYDNNLTQFAGLNQNLSVTVPSNIADYNIIEYTTKDGFVWQGKDLTQKCYRSVKDNNIKAWVQESDTKKAILNLGYSITNEIEYLAFNASRANENITLRVLKSDYDRYWNTEQYKMPAWIYYNQLGTRPAGWYRGLGAGPEWVVYIYAAWKNERHLKYGNNMYQIKTRNSAFDGYKKTESEVWNGKDTPEDGIEKDIDVYGLDSITIDDEQYTRYPDGDYGIDSSNKVYTGNVLQPGESIYSDTERIAKISTIKEYVRDNPTGGKSYIIADDNQVFYYQNKDTYNIPNYYKKSKINLKFIEMVKGIVQYPYPAEEGRSLTDTTWDNNLWVLDGYQTKRFVLSDQYFETIQYEFSGTTINNSMCIAGFEVDGIQITEVPY